MMVEMKFIRVTYKQKLVFEMKLQPDGTWSMKNGPQSRPKQKKKPNRHFRKLKSAYNRYLNR